MTASNSSFKFISKDEHGKYIPHLKFMSDFNTSFKFIYKDEYGQNNLSFKYTYIDGVATLLNPKCENCKVIFDQSVVKYLKKIESEQCEYTFQSDGIIWAIYPLFQTSTIIADYIFAIVTGDMIDDGLIKICTNPIPNPVRPPNPTEP